MKTLKAVVAKYNQTSLILRILIGLAVGSVLALVAPGAGWVGELGSLFVGALKGIAPVLVFIIVASALAQGSSLNAVTVTENDFGYVTFTARQTGDPYLNYIGGTSTKVGRWLLVKYNHSVIPRMQLYMAQGAGITSDNNMIEFPIAANGSGWTYVIVDMATNQFYDKENQTVQHFRFDPLEARNWSGGSYQFTGEEAIDVAYIMGFTTKAGLMGYLEANELHDVTKTAVLQESQVTMAGDKATYTDENGNVTVIHGTYDPATKSGSGFEGRKVKGTIHWVACQTAVKATVRLYENIIDEEKGVYNEDGSLNLNPNSLTVKEAWIEPSLKEAKPYESFQFVRQGYFCVDYKDSKPGEPVFNRIVSLKSSFKLPKA